MKELRSQAAKMVQDLFEVIDVPLEELTEQETQVVAVFAFGMLFRIAYFQELEPPAVEALGIMMLNDTFQYGLDDAVALAFRLMRSSDPPFEDDVTHALMQRGVDGHMQWQDGDHEDLRDNLVDALKTVCGETSRW